MSRATGDRGFTLLELLVVIVILGLIMVLAIPGLISARKSSNEGSAIAGLKTIITQQALFKEGDSEEDKNFDYGTLAELSETTLIDSVLGSGSKSGYRFQAAPSLNTPDVLWYAVANPALATQTGDRYFATHQSGVIFFTHESSFSMDLDDCQPPSTALPVR